MKKGIAVLILFFFFLNMSLTGVKAEPANEEAAYLNSNGIIVGSNGDLMLDKYFTVEELMTILSRLAGEEETAKSFTKATSFTDVPKNRWSEPFISWAENKGVMKGIGNGKSGYLDRVSAQRLLAFLLRVLNYNDVSWNDTYSFGRSLGLLDLIDIAPQQELTRGQMSKILYKALDTNLKGSVKLSEKLGLKKSKPNTGTELEPSAISSLVGVVKPWLTDPIITQMSLVGSILIFSIGLNLLGIV
ncbi:MAG TPA: DUF554 family protein, partial [Ruminiclostridium sp.]|nr:DUF554 family protein [Ruminiclostridium sp.]